MHTYAHKHTTHILQICLPLYSEVALLSKLPGLQSYTDNSLSYIIKCIQKEVQWSKKGKELIPQEQKATKEHRDNNPFTYVGNEEGASAAGH